MERIDDDAGAIGFHDRAPWINVTVGILVFVSRWVIHETSLAADWNVFLTGIAIVLIGLTAAAAHGQHRRNYWSVLNGFLGAWLIVSDAIWPNAARLHWSQICLGVIAIMTSFISLSNERLYERHVLHR